MFRPARIVPNTLDPALDGLDWDVINAIFASSLDPSSPASVVTSEEIASLLERLDNLIEKEAEEVEKQVADESRNIKGVRSKAKSKGREDAAISNLQGGKSAQDAAKRWAENGNQIANEDADRQDEKMEARKVRTGMGTKMKRVLVRSLGLPLDEDDEQEVMTEAQELGEESQESVSQVTSEVWKTASASQSRLPDTASINPPTATVDLGLKPASPSKSPSLTKSKPSTDLNVPVANIPIRVFPWSPVPKRPSGRKRLVYHSSRRWQYEEVVHSDEETQRDDEDSAMVWVLNGCVDKIVSPDIEGGFKEGKMAGEAMINVGAEADEGAVVAEKFEAKTEEVGSTPEKTERTFRTPLTPEPEPTPRSRTSRRTVKKHPTMTTQEGRTTGSPINGMQTPPSTSEMNRMLDISSPSVTLDSRLPKNDRLPNASQVSKRKRTTLSSSSYLPTPSSTPAVRSARTGCSTEDPAPVRRNHYPGAREDMEVSDYLPLGRPHSSSPESTAAPLSTKINNLPTLQNHSHSLSQSGPDPAPASQDDSSVTYREHRRKRRRVEEWLDETKDPATALGRDAGENSQPGCAADVAQGSPRRHRVLPTERGLPGSPSKNRPTHATSLSAIPLPFMLSTIPSSSAPSASKRPPTLVQSSQFSRSTSASGSVGDSTRLERDEKQLRMIKMLRALRPDLATPSTQRLSQGGSQASGTVNRPSQGRTQ